MTSSYPHMDIRQEIRFAVVLYGGVSLAIYMNGVTQELLQLSLATAIDPDPKRAGAPLESAVTGTAVTYRQVAQVLSLSNDARERLEKELSIGSGPSLEAQLEGAPIRVKFVIDTISGTSAGGINGVFLAKALANNQKLDNLKHLWIEEADILKLINDAKSVDETNLQKTRQPASLLNGQRMYLKLIDELDAMDRAGSGNNRASGHVEELDAFVTTTDVAGLPTSLRLSDDVVSERRYKNVIQLQHRQFGELIGVTDFGRDNNPFLAFAARCTASFPFAFEPMQLKKIGEVLVCAKDHENEGALGEDPRWEHYFPEYRSSNSAMNCDPGTKRSDCSERSFADGGYLDNKPFSYAIAMLSRRAPRLPTERKLVYIEPDPEPSQLGRNVSHSPNAVENALRSQTIARYETIREDLQRVTERNRFVERVLWLLYGCDEEVSVWTGTNTFDDEALFLEGDPQKLIAKYGPAYGGYHRLKIGALTDEFGDWIAAALDRDREPAYVSGIRFLIRIWRRRTYGFYLEDGKEWTKNRFLYDFDLPYRIRRLRYVLRRLDEIKNANERWNHDQAQQELGKMLSRFGIEAPTESLRAESESLWRLLADISAQLHKALEPLMLAREALLLSDYEHKLMQSRASGGATGSAACQDTLGWQPQRDAHPLAELLKDWPVSVEVAHTILRGRTQEDRAEEAENQFIQLKLQDTFDGIEKALKGYVSQAAVAASKASRDMLEQKKATTAGWCRAVSEMVFRLYDRYQGYDFASFPVVYATDVGEEIAPAEVIRISPADAKTLVNPERSDRRQKLAGTTMFHFGAFFEKTWRQNDMLWGQLDGAERLISTLLPRDCPSIRDALIRDAQLRILEEHYKPVTSNAVLSYASSLLSKLSAPRKERSMLGRIFKCGVDLEEEVQSVQTAVLRSEKIPADVIEGVLRDSIGTAALLEFFKRPDGYAVSRNPTPATTARAMARSATVVGRILDGIGDQGGAWSTKRIVSSLARIGSVGWGLVELATPTNVFHVLYRRWAAIMVLLGLALIVVGFIPNFGEAQKVGAVIVVFAGLLYLAVRAVADWFMGRSNIVDVVKFVCILAVLLLATYGLYEIWRNGLQL